LIAGDAMAEFEDLMRSGLHGNTVQATSFIGAIDRNQACWP